MDLGRCLDVRNPGKLESTLVQLRPLLRAVSVGSTNSTIGSHRCELGALETLYSRVLISSNVVNNSRRVIVPEASARTQLQLQTLPSSSADLPG